MSTSETYITPSSTPKPKSGSSSSSVKPTLLTFHGSGSNATIHTIQLARLSRYLRPHFNIIDLEGGGGRGSGGGGGGGGRSPPARALPNSNVGGSTSAGSGAPRGYGGGVYGGGASVPYKAGTRSTGGIRPGALLLPGAALLIFPGLWLYSVYPYHMNSYRYYNRTAERNESLPVVCLCEEHKVCGCDNNNNTQYLDDIVGNGSYDGLNKSLVTVADVNGTRSLVINGTLPNGTTAPGGSDDAGVTLKIGQLSGYWVMVMTVVFMVTYL